MFLIYGFHGKFDTFKCFCDFFCFFFCLDLEFLDFFPFDFGEFSWEFLFVFFEKAFDGPVFFDVESLPFSFTFYDETGRDGLDAAS